MSRLLRRIHLLRRRPDAGMLEVELAAMVVIAVGLIYIIVYAGRLGLALLAVEDAASEAGRAASISRTSGEASAAAQDAVDTTLDASWVQCTPTITLDTSAFSSDPGTPGTVTGTIHCDVDMSDVAVAGVPSSVTLTRSFESPIDTFRERG